MDPAEPTPADATDAALDRLGKLVAAGAPPGRVTQAVGEIVAGWADEPDVDAGVARARVERLWDSLSKDAADLQEQIGDATEADARALAGAKRMLAAMQAAVAALAAAHERL